MYDTDISQSSMLVDLGKIRQIAEVLGLISRPDGLGLDNALIRPLALIQPNERPRNARVRRRSERPSDSASMSSQPPEAPDATDQPDSSLHSLEQMLQSLTTQMLECETRREQSELQRERWEQRMEHRLANLDERQRLHAEYAMAYNAAPTDLDAHNPDFPSYLLQPYQPPDDEMAAPESEQQRQSLPLLLDFTFKR